jgi:hypothetical protein
MRLPSRVVNCRPICEVRGLIRNVYRVYKWLPVIWKNYDFDHHYIWIVLRHKLQMMENHFRSHRILLNWEKTCAEIHHAIEILDRIIADEYETEAFVDHRKKWGELHMDTDENRRLRLWRENATTDEEKEQEREETIAAFEFADQTRRDDVDELFKFVADHYLGWWD